MRPGLSGWKATASDPNQYLIVEYRLPLRKNWLIRSAQNPNASICQSRSGLIHLAKPLEKDSQNNSSKKRRFKLFRFSVIALALLVPIIWMGISNQLFPAQIYSQESYAQVAARDSASISNCSDSEVVSMTNLGNALNGSPSQLKILEKSASIELGGYRLTSMTVECQMQIFRVKITEAKFESAWKLKKAARLEN